MPAFSLAYRPRHNHLAASPSTQRSPTTPNPWPVKLTGYMLRIRGFGGVLEPRYIVGARSLDQ